MSSPRARSRNSARAVRKMIGIVGGRARPRSAPRRRPSRRARASSRRAGSRPAAPGRGVEPGGPSRGLEHRHPLRLEVDAAEQPDGRLVVDDRTLVMDPSRRLVPETVRSHSPEREARAEVEPPPSSESTQIRPPIASTSPSAMNSPSPVARADRAGSRVAAIELAEDPLVLGVRDPDALVLDADLDEPVPAARGDGDRAARRARANRVVDQVGEHLAQLVPVGRRRSGSSGTRGRGGGRPGRRRLERSDGLADDRADVGRRRAPP